MAYCDNCGAYIPDGQTTCLACGKATGNSGAAYDYAKDNERRGAEERRARRQEEDHRWAEQEFDRRQREAEKKAETYVNKTAETSKRTTSSRTEQTADSEKRNTSSRVGRASPRPADFRFDTGTKDNRLFAILSYVSLLFLLPFFVDGCDDFAKYHAKQGARLFAASLIATVALSILGLGGLAAIVALARIALMIKGILTAVQGKCEPLPYIGTIKF